MKPRITFGMIVLNGEPYTRFNLRALYPYAHQIIVVEGACRSAADMASGDGHSVDGTVEELRRFCAGEDTEKKITVVTARDEGYADGFWPEKDEMSQAYARRATGDVLWQIDSDEFYRDEDMAQLLAMLEQGADTISVPTLHFFGGLGYRVEGFHMTCDRYEEYHRIFKWGPGHTYKTHRPPTVLDAQGIDLRKKKWIRAESLKKRGMYMYHYCYLFPHQVLKKATYYTANARMGKWQIPGAQSWAQDVYLGLARPYRMFIKETMICWLERFSAPHPAQVNLMWNAVKSGEICVETRGTDDIESLLRKPTYGLGRFALRVSMRLLANRPGRMVRHYYFALGRHLREGSLFRRMMGKPHTKTTS